MKPNEYIKKYNLKDTNSKFNHKEFVGDLTIDLNAMVEYHRQVNWSHVKFQNCISDIRSKFNSISNKTGHPNINEKLWGYFFATVLAPMRDVMFGDQLRHESEERERVRRERSRYNFNSITWEEEFMRILHSLLIGINTRPTSSFEVLKLGDTATKEEIKKRHWELATLHHPDKGGSPAEFRKITEARDRCLAYVS